MIKPKKKTRPQVHNKIQEHLNTAILAIDKAILLAQENIDDDYFWGFLKYIIRSNQG